MNIKDYYSHMSRLYIHQTIFSAIVLVIVILPGLKITHLFPARAAGIFVFIYTVYFFFRYLYFSYRSDALPSPYINNKSGLNLLVIIPSVANAGWNLYLGSGICQLTITELKGRKKRLKKKGLSIDEKANVYKIINHEKNMIWYVSKGRNKVNVFTSESKLTFAAFRPNKREYYLKDEKNMYHIKKTAFKYRVAKNDEEIMSITQGVMAINLQRLFNASTPIVKFDRNIHEYEKHLCLSMALFFK